MLIVVVVCDFVKEVTGVDDLHNALHERLRCCRQGWHAARLLRRIRCRRSQLSQTLPRTHATASFKEVQISGWPLCPGRCRRQTASKRLTSCDVKHSRPHASTVSSPYLPIILEADQVFIPATTEAYRAEVNHSYSSWQVFVKTTGPVVPHSLASGALHRWPVCAHELN